MDELMGYDFLDKHHVNDWILNTRLWGVSVTSPLPFIYSVLRAGAYDNFRPPSSRLCCESLPIFLNSAQGMAYLLMVRLKSFGQQKIMDFHWRTELTSR
jgi:hypothetical protein